MTLPEAPRSEESPSAAQLYDLSTQVQALQAQLRAVQAQQTPVVAQAAPRAVMRKDQVPQEDTCPRCKKSDQMQKVSAIVAAGTTTGTMASTSRIGYGVMSTVGANVNRTVLSQHLAAPLAPLYRTVGVGPVVALLVAGCAVLVGIGTVGTDPATGGVWLGGGLLGIVVLVWYLVAETSRRKRVYDDEDAQWEIAMWRWEQLFYCHRCDGVFMPRTLAPFAPLAQVKAYLFYASEIW